MKEQQKTKGPEKLPYTPPEVVRVSLRPEEAVLGHCKTSTSTGPAAATCKTYFCRTFGS
jgi:hypothetical protein